MSRVPTSPAAWTRAAALEPALQADHAVRIDHRERLERDAIVGRNQGRIETDAERERRDRLSSHCVQLVSSLRQLDADDQGDDRR